MKSAFRRMSFLPWLLLLVITAASACAQTASSGAVIGTVTDASGAVVPKATVTLVDTSTNATATSPTNDQGQFVFPNVAPGPYKLTVKMQGFRTATIPNLTVQVNKSLSVPVQLQVGAASEIVEVQATAQLELQTTDAQIGNAISNEAISRLPMLQRNVSELMNLQPGVSPGTNLGMRTTGAIDDQNTVKLDGIDITANVVASRTVIPTPAEAVEEFRIAVSNPTQELGRSSGGQITMVGRHGTNTPHGAVYWSHQNDNLNANTWDNNFSKIKKPELKDNRFGARVGGPIIHDKTFFFGLYEGRRFPRVSQVTRTVPTDTLKQGILRFRDSAGNVQSFDLKTAAVCGSSGTTLCDPRGLGISPYTKAFWALMPSGNLSTVGDGLNTTGYLANIGSPVNDDFGTFRLDHNFSERLKFNGSYAYFRDIATGTGQVDIRNGQSKSAVLTPQRGELIDGSLSWQIHPTLFNVFRYGYVWNRNSNNAISPTAGATLLALPGTTSSGGGCAGSCVIAALPASNSNSGFLDSPIDMDTQRARFQSDNDKQIQYIDDVNWVHGNHSVQFGGQFNHLPYTHVRADKVVGSLSSLVATMDTGSLSIPGVNTPRTCSASVTTNCLRSADATTYSRLYAAALGLVDNVSILAMRDKNLNPLPFGTFLNNITQQNAYYFYGQDSWRVKPSLTLTYGVAYGWQAPPTEKLGRQTIQIDAATGQPLDAESYLKQKAAAALSGQVFNPTYGYEPVDKAGRSVFDTDWGDIAPRVAFAWNPTGKLPIAGKLLGDRKTVIRGGFALIYDRSNTVQSVEIPMLGVGFDQNVNITTPLCNVSGPGGAGCNPGATLTNPGLASFRVGVDGNIPVPSVPGIGNPVVPPTGNSTSPTSSGFTESLSFQVDPKTKVGRSYNIDLGFQRELPGNMVIEASYAGRFARHLPQAVNLNQSPYFFVDKASGQSFAQAFDAVATQIRAGVTAANVTPQPWFENQLAGASTTATQTVALLSGVRGVAGQSSNFNNGNLSAIFQNMGKIRRALGLQPYNNDQTQVAFMRTYIGQSNYNGLLVSLRNRPTHGVTFGVNYTYSKTLDDNLSNQNNAGFYSNAFHPGVDYGPSTFDRTHVLNLNYVYDLPAGRGHAFASHGVLRVIFGGWYNSGIFQWDSGLPLFVSQGQNAWGGGLILAPNSNAVPITLGSLPSTGLNDGIAGSGGTATTGNPATGGSGKNIFSDPNAAFGSFRRILLATDTRTGKGQPMRGLGFWNLDTTVGKTTALTERVNMRFSADFFNAFNHPNFSTPSPNLQSQSSFGVISSTNTLPNRVNSARWIEFGMRFDF